MQSTVEIVENAIDLSIREGRTVTLTRSDFGRTPEDLEAVLSRLFMECEGEVDNGDVHEHWGVDLDGRTWRVDVRLR